MTKLDLRKFDITLTLVINEIALDEYLATSTKSMTGNHGIEWPK